MRRSSSPSAGSVTGEQRHGICDVAWKWRRFSGMSLPASLGGGIAMSATTMPKKRLRRPTTSELRRFRSGLSEYEAQEHLLFLGAGWDVVIARWIIQQFPRQVQALDVKSWAQGYGFDAVLPPHLRREGKVSQALVTVDLAHALSDAVDIGQPVIAGQMALDGKIILFLLDGHHRLLKAYGLALPTLPAFLLSLAETALCRISLEKEE